jgi:hypothetical protein
VSEPTIVPEANERYLEAALAWLRLRLERLAQRRRPPASGPPAGRPAAAPLEEADPPWWQWWRGEPTGSEEPIRPPLAALPSPGPVTDEHIATAEAAMAEAGAVEPRPALLVLADRLGLSRFERDVLLLCAALELDQQVPQLCAQADDGQAYPTAALALELFDDPRSDLLAAERGLRYWQLVEVVRSPERALISSPLRADDRAVDYIRGSSELDGRLAALLSPVDEPAGPDGLPPSQRAVAERVARRLEQADPDGWPLVQLLGSDALSKLLVASQIAGDLGRRLYRLPVDYLPSGAGELDGLARLWQRESRLLPIALYLDAQGLDGAGEADPAWLGLRRFLGRGSDRIFLGLREVWSGSGSDYLATDVERPSAAEQRAAWEAQLGTTALNTPELLAGQFNLNLATIRRIAAAAQAEADADQPERRRERLWEACLAETRPRLDQLAQRLEPKATWDDLVLPPAETDLLRRIAAQVWQRSTVYDAWGFADRMNRGFGVTALFAGPSGTGKTMAAEVLANALRLHLYRIDLSAVVSKYIGETEKNLRRLFDAAEDGGALLFFDEADALFGKRSEVKDSHDRYANIEINYLLQRMEAYRGVAVLATNMKRALDQAFLRRLRFVVNFPFPALAERREMWRKAFPARMPPDQLGQIDLDRLARLPATGGVIHNVALNAAFAAAASGGQLTMELVLEAARIEFRKLEQPVPEVEFEWRASGASA